MESVPIVGLFTLIGTILIIWKIRSSTGGKTTHNESLSAPETTTADINSEKERRISLWVKRNQILDKKLKVLESDGYVITKPDWMNNRDWVGHPMDLVNVYDAFFNNKAISRVEYNIATDIQYFNSNYHSGSLRDPELTVLPPVRVVDLFHAKDNGETLYCVGREAETWDDYYFTLSAPYHEAKTLGVASKLITLEGETKTDDLYTFAVDEVIKTVESALQDNLTLEIIYVQIQADTSINARGNTKKVRIDSMEFPFLKAVDIHSSITEEFTLHPSDKQIGYKLIIGARNFSEKISTQSLESSVPLRKIESTDTSIRAKDAQIGWNLTIEEAILSDLVSYCSSQLPNVACGILGGCGSKRHISDLHKIPSMTPSPYRWSFNNNSLIKSFDELNAKGKEILAFFSSRPHSPPYPSETDIEFALKSKWVDVCYLYVDLTVMESPRVAVYLINSEGDCELTDVSTSRQENEITPPKTKPDISKITLLTASKLVEEDLIPQFVPKSELLKVEKAQIKPLSSKTLPLTDVENYRQEAMQRERDEENSRRDQKISAAGKIAKVLGNGLLDRTTVHVKYEGDESFSGYIDVYATRNLFYRNGTDSKLVNSEQNIHVDTQNGFHELGELECYEHGNDRVRILKFPYISKAKSASKNIFLEKEAYEPSDGFVRARYHADTVSPNINFNRVYEFTFRDYIDLLKSEGTTVNRGLLFDDKNNPNNIIGHIAKSLLGIDPDEQSLSRSRKLTSYEVLKTAFGFNSRYDRLISLANDGPIWRNKANPLDMLITLTEAFPAIADAQFLPDELPEKWSKTFAGKGGKFVAQKSDTLNLKRLNISQEQYLTFLDEVKTYLQSNQLGDPATDTYTFLVELITSFEELISNLGRTYENSIYKASHGYGVISEYVDLWSDEVGWDMDGTVLDSAAIPVITYMISQKNITDIKKSWEKGLQSLFADFESEVVSYVGDEVVIVDFEDEELDEYAEDWEKEEREQMEEARDALISDINSDSGFAYREAISSHEKQIDAILSKISYEIKKLLRTPKLSDEKLLEKLVYLIDAN